MTGRRFVFILDRSQSMGGQGLGVLSQAQNELSEAISRLQENHQLLIYNQGMVLKYIMTKIIEN